MSRSRAGRVIGGPTRQRGPDKRTEEQILEAALAHQQATIKYLERRGDSKTREIRKLRNQVRELGGDPV